MSWRKIWLVLRREYLYNFKRPSFLLTAFGVPLISFGAIFIVGRVTAQRETNLDSFQRVGYVDHAGIVSAEGSNPDGYQPVEGDANQQLVDGNLDAYFVIAEDYILTGKIDLYARKSIPEALRNHVEDFMRAQIVASVPGNLLVPQQRLQENPDISIRDLDTGDKLSEAALVGRLLLPFVFVLVYFMVTNTTAQFLMSGVVEEKENRLMEILATSLRPLELLWGKLLGLGALSLTQVVVWGIAGVLIVSVYSGARDFVSGATFQLADIILFVGLFLTNFLLFSAAMLGIGASVTAESESRQIAGLFTFITVLPLALLATFFSNPNGPLPLLFTFFPFTAAVALILRMGLTALPTWQIVLSVAIQLVSVFVVMWLAAKVFRLGMLMYGKRLSPGELWRALREGRLVLTTASSEGAPVTKAKKKGWLGR
jgi:ABC-2 type transport system permease protein